jgi:lipoprotein-anchoring transpeptidase ErfK/SrfK
MIRGLIRAGAGLLAVLVFGTAPEAMAQGSGWQDGRPVFGGGGRGQWEQWPQNQWQQWQYDQRRRERSYTVYPEIMSGGPRPPIDPAAPPIVSLPKAEPAGTIIIDSGGRKLYYTLAGNQAYAYPISVGREGFAWTGTEKISRVAEWPDWHPPAEMRQREPGLPKIMHGGIKNPLGAKALYLGNSLYRIHGTNDPRTIGLAASSGCFRMMNEHVTHLASLAKIGTTVRVVANYRGGSLQSSLQ